MVSLDTHDHLSSDLLQRQTDPARGSVFGHQCVYPGDALQSLRQPCPCEPSTLLVLDLEIVVILSLVISDEQHLVTPPVGPHSSGHSIPVNRLFTKGSGLGV